MADDDVTRPRTNQLTTEYILSLSTWMLPSREENIKALGQQVAVRVSSSDTAEYTFVLVEYAYKDEWSTE